MKGSLSKLKKLRGRGAGELAGRARQSLAALAERRGVSARARVPGEAALSHLVNRDVFGGAEVSAESLLAHFRSRANPRFCASFDDTAATVAEWRRRFGSDDEQELVARAERAVGGEFDLLGLRGLRFDADKGSGGDIDWHLEPLSGRRAPLAHWSRVEYLNAEAVGDKKIIWELNRHQHFLLLGRAHLLTSDERYARAFAAHLRSWVAANPPKFGINWASSLEVAFRSISWLWALHFFKHSPTLTPELFSLALRLLVVHARHLETYLSTYFSPNTHLTGEALGLFYLGALLPELKESARWRERGQQILLGELDRQVRADGTYFEQASYYQRYTADFYTHLLVLARRNHVALGAHIESKLTALLDHLMHVTRPDGRATLYGDDDGGRLAPLDLRAADDFRAALANGTALFGRGDYKHVAGAQAGEETLWLLGPQGLAEFDRVEASPPNETSRAFADGGCYVMRDGWHPDANYMLLDCGLHGALSSGHSHADALSFELCARGRAVLIDPGTYTYTGSRQDRDYFRATRAHNALVIDGESSSEPGACFNWRTQARAQFISWLSETRFDFFEGEHDGYTRLPNPATHRRAVFFIRGGFWLLRDRVEGEGERRRAELCFHFSPDAAPQLEEAIGGVRVDADDAGAGLGMFTFGGGTAVDSGGGVWREESGWVSRCYGARKPSSVVVYEAKGAGAQEFFTFLVPSVAGERVAAVREVAATGGRAFELRRGQSGVEMLLVRDAAAEVCAAGRVTTDFDFAYLHFNEDAGVPGELILIGGRRLTLDGRKVLDAPARLPHAAARREGNLLVFDDAADLPDINLEDHVSDLEPLSAGV